MKGCISSSSIIGGCSISGPAASTSAITNGRAVRRAIATTRLCPGRRTSVGTWRRLRKGRRASGCGYCFRRGSRALEREVYAGVYCNVRHIGQKWMRAAGASVIRSSAGRSVHLPLEVRTRSTGMPAADRTGIRVTKSASEIRNPRNPRRSNPRPLKSREIRVAQIRVRSNPRQTGHFTIFGQIRVRKSAFSSNPRSAQIRVRSNPRSSNPRQTGHFTIFERATYRRRH